MYYLRREIGPRPDFTSKIVHVLGPDFTSKIVHVLAFGIPKFYIAPYDKINHGLVNLSCNCDVKFHVEVSTRISIRNTQILHCALR